MNTNKDNKLIAEFMGNSHKKLCWERIPKNYQHLPKYFQYNTSWDWLMPVVKKIVEDTKEPLENVDMFDDLRDEIIESLTTLDIESLYDSVTKFIKWYNKNK